MIKSYKDLRVWKKTLDLTESVYIKTRKLPDEERFGLVTQLRRAAISVGVNIAEGSGRGTRKDFKYFVSISYGSAKEVEALLIICERLYPWLDISNEREIVTDILKMLSGLRAKLS